MLPLLPIAIAIAVPSILPSMRVESNSMCLQIATEPTASGSGLDDTSHAGTRLVTLLDDADHYLLTLTNVCDDPLTLTETDCEATPCLLDLDLAVGETTTLEVAAPAEGEWEEHSAEVDDGSPYRWLTVHVNGGTLEPSGGGTTPTTPGSTSGGGGCRVARPIHPLSSMQRRRHTP